MVAPYPGNWSSGSGSGGMIAFELVTIAVSLGDAQTLARLSIGLESVEDIEADIGEALDVARAVPLRRAC